jgi:hypothetical protein
MILLPNIISSEHLGERLAGHVTISCTGVSVPMGKLGAVIFPQTFLTTLGPRHLSTGPFCRADPLLRTDQKSLGQNVLIS